MTNSRTSCSLADGAFLPATLLLLLLMVGGGCLPSSCAGSGPARALLPADSLSRRVAQSVLVDTLRRVWRADASEDVPLQFPRTALFLSPGDNGPARVAVSDAEREALFLFSGTGRLARTVRSERFATPYLIGQRGDTLLALSPRERRVHFVAGGRVARNVALALPAAGEAPLLWGMATGGALFAKTIGEDGKATVTRHGPGGQVVASRALTGPQWHHAGPLEAWRDSLVSTSGYRPVLHRLPLNLAGRRDTARALRLTGFDSPMLPRTRRYAEGDLRQPPLLMPDVAATRDRLFALNLRAGRLRVDAFGPGGRLEARLTVPGPTRSQDVYPRAVAARVRPGGGYALAVTFTDPRPAVALYHWQPGAAFSRAGR
ncbi:MAG: hypothetical protein BRD48_06335 [Bacteroidetes bacterium QS_9_68_14]|nr:MAG: hypothetical protein BRD48_06335 [Bacteroidetes bacterium QS_9_68_14]